MMSTSDRRVLRSLAKHVSEIAAHPIQAERRALWKRHNSLQPCQPLILVFPEGAWAELLPDQALVCVSEAARCIERALRSRIHRHEHFRDDTVIEAEWTVKKVIWDSGWGLEPRRIASSTEGGA